MSGTWRPDKSEIWETHQKHVFVATKKYRHRIHQRTGRHCHDRGKPQKHQTDERVLLPLGIYGPPRRNYVYRTIEKHTRNSNKCIPIVGGDFNAELGPGQGTDCTSVGKHTRNGGNKRGGWMNHWLLIFNFTALNTMDRKTHDLQISKRKREANRPQHNQERALEMQQRCRSERYDPHGQWSQMCHGNIRDHHSTERWLCKVKTSSRQQNMTDEIKLTTKLENRSLSSKKDTKRSLKNQRKS